MESSHLGNKAEYRLLKDIAEGAWCGKSLASMAYSTLILP